MRVPGHFGVAAPRSPARSVALVLLGALVAGAGIALTLDAVKGCRSATTAECLGTPISALVLIAGLGLTTVATLVRSHERSRTLTKRDLLAVLVIVLAADVAWFYGEEWLNPGDDAWDGRLIPIRLMLLVAVPFLATMTYAALVRLSSWHSILLSFAAVPVTYVLPFVLIVLLAVAGIVGS